MEWTKSDVPVGKRAMTWGASLAVGAAMYFIFGALLTSGLRTERVQTKGKIDAILAGILAQPKGASKEELAALQAKSRATSSYLWVLHQRDEALRREIEVKNIWSIAIGLVACAGCFALCTVNWIRREDGARQAPQPAAPAAA